MRIADTEDESLEARQARVNALPRKIFRTTADDPDAADAVPAKAPAHLSATAPDKPSLHSWVLQEPYLPPPDNPLARWALWASSWSRRAALTTSADLSKVNLAHAAASAATAWGLSWLLWQSMSSFAVSWARVEAPIDFYVLQRLAAVFRTLIVAAMAMGSSICFLNGVGVSLLLLRLIYGHLSGEFTREQQAARENPPPEDP
ncbi:hypothetical protein CDCA_CDCA01G0054 [Cyanidium caldarium]|uniref:PRA1 family protein n=1 Tax=Cyanidium caldarium TaxID=2771 RepID=A0AAV9INX1_CYACA|nr:hypothetical protein CDCA_CDCA01G0054 [Cyanidium caldarium]